MRARADGAPPAARGLYIDGAWAAPAAGGTFETLDPATGEVLAVVPAAGAGDVDRAVRAARRAFDEGPWPRLPGPDRARALRAIATAIRADIDRLAEMEVRDNGKPLPEALGDVGDAAGCFEFYAGLAAAEGDPEEIALPDPRFRSRAERVALGVIAAIVPWNYPLLMAAWKVAPALAAGCAVVLKPSELTPLSALELAAIAHDAGVPPGVLNVLTGTGLDAGAPLAAHAGVDKIAFTGSGPTGSRLMAEAARDVKRISLELGGKSPFVIFEDADLAAAVEWAMFGIFWNQGQVCSATSRVLVHEALHDAFLDRLVAEARRIPIGDGMAAGTLLGPLASAAQRDKVADAVDAARAAGARVATGGRVPPGRNRGYFFEPTVLVDVPTGHAAWREEIFGPVVCVRPFATEDEAVALANDSRFGLAAAVMSADLDRAERVASRLRAGIVWINCSQPTFSEAPWGGLKQSGLGRELGRWGYEACQEIRQVTTYASPEPWGWYIR